MNLFRKSMFLVATCVGALSVAMPARADVKAGVDAWAQGSFKAAVDEWRPLAIKGDADAQFNLAQAYKLGRGVPTDLQLAEEWYRKAAVQGHVPAQDNYGLALFQNGKRADAVPWLEKSAARGEPRAQLVLGTMLFNGDGVTKDWVRAYALLTRSSAAGLARGSQTLAQMDQYISLDVRQKGIALAKQYEAEATYAAASQGSLATIRPTDVPASTVASGDAQPLKPARGPAPGPTAAKRATGSSAAAPPATVAATPAHAPAAAIAAAPDGKGWRVQFGAFRDGGNAQRLWQQLSGRVGALAGLQPFYSRAGTLTKLQAGTLRSSGDAARVCAEVRAKAAGTPCVAIAP
ncbi:MAG: SPOR domain-containing protein [Sphingomonas sp.]